MTAAPDVTRERPGSSVIDAVFMLTDVEGSTRHWEDDAEAMHRALLRHDAILDREVSDAHGRLLQSRGEGDSAFAVFSDPAEAVPCAIAIQRAFHTEQWPTSRPLRLRIGLHVGSALGREGEYFGPAVNRCARLRDLGHGGQILASSDCVRALGDRAGHDTTFRHLGEHSLRGIEVPVSVFQVVHPDLPSAFPRLPSAGKALHNLPPEPTSFFGRRRELARLAERLASSRLVTLTGPGGVGKTRLALRAARDALEEFPDGVWLVDLAVLGDARFLTNVAASTMRVPEEPARPLMETIVDFLSHRRLLLVLDNCEHLVEGCAAFADRVLGAAPGVTILATSRAVLGIDQETSMLVEPLAVAGRGPGPPGDAVMLFVDRARSAGAAMEASPQISEICSRLDGLPLAIELAASWAPTLSLGQITSGLSDSLLEAGKADDPRHGTIRASVEWSYDLLDDAERVLFRRLSVFGGAFTTEAIEAVCCFAPIEKADAARLVAGLARTSLVVVERSKAPGRYRLLETLRRYGAERSSEAGEVQTLQDRLVAYVVSVCEEAEPHLSGEGRRTWSARLDVERDNVRGALELCAARPDHPSFLRIAAAMARHWTNSSTFAEATTWLQAGAAFDDAPPLVIARARWALGYVSVYRLDFMSAIGPLQQALQTFREEGDEQGMARCLCWLGYAAVFAGGPPVAIPLLDEAASHARSCGDRWALVVALVGKGLLLTCYSDPAAARAELARAVALAREVDAPTVQAAALGFIGMAEFYAGEYRRARAVLYEALAVDTAAGASAHAETALMFLAATLDQMGMYEESRAAVRDASDVTEKLGHRVLGTSFMWLARISFHEGKLAEARALVERALESPSGGLALFGPQYRSLRAEILLAQGELDAAAATLDEAIAWCRSIEFGYMLGRCSFTLGRVRRALGDAAGAVEALREASEFVGTFGDKATAVDILEWAAGLAAEGEHDAMAARLLGAAKALRASTGYEVSPFVRSTLQEVARRVEARLGPDETSRERKAGAAFSSSEALAMAVSAAG